MSVWSLTVTVTGTPSTVEEVSVIAPSFGAMVFSSTRSMSWPESFRAMIVVVTLITPVETANESLTS